MRFINSKEMKVSVLPEQQKNLSSKEKIYKACLDDNVLAFDIYKDNLLVGFVMVRKYDDGAYFLWDFAIDYKYQNQKIGYEALVKFIDYMVNNYNLLEMTTTYIWGNNHARYLYEKVGFIETDIVEEPGCHEVNMIYRHI